MLNLFKSCYVALALAAGVGFTGCTTTAEAPSVSKEAQSQPLSFDLKAGQVLQIAMLSERKTDAAKAIRSEYFQTAIPHAASLGDKYMGNLKVKSTLMGKQSPRAIALWVFPNKAAQNEFRSSPKWPDYVQMRHDGWEELNVYSATIADDITLTFDPDKDYTFAAAWTRPGTAPSYVNYLDSIETDFDEIGANYLARFDSIDLQATPVSFDSPSHMTLVEWSDGPNLKGLQQTKAYQANAKQFSSAVSRFDLYWVNSPSFANYPTPR